MNSRKNTVTRPLVAAFSIGLLILLSACSTRQIPGIVIENETLDRLTLVTVSVDQNRHYRFGTLIPNALKKDAIATSLDLNGELFVHWVGSNGRTNEQSIAIDSIGLNTASGYVKVTIGTNGVSAKRLDE